MDIDHDELADRRKPGFFLVDNCLIDEYAPQIGAYGLAVYSVLARYAGRGRCAFPSYETIAARLNMSRRKVAYCIDQLVALGLIHKEPRTAKGGKTTSNLYTLIDLDAGQEQYHVADDRVEVEQELGMHDMQNRDASHAPLDGRGACHARSGVHDMHGRGACHARSGVHDMHAKKKQYEEYTFTKTQVKKREREPTQPTPTPTPTPAHAQTPQPAILESGVSGAKRVKLKSHYVDLSRFGDTGYIPPGAGRNPVEVYYERFLINRDAERLNNIQEDDLIRNCPDLDQLRDVVIAYSRANYRPGNVQLILDWYRDGPPARQVNARQNGAGNRPMSRVEASMQAIDNVFDRLEQEQVFYGIT